MIAQSTPKDRSRVAQTLYLLVAREWREKECGSYFGFCKESGRSAKGDKGRKSIYIPYSDCWSILFQHVKRMVWTIARASNDDRDEYIYVPILQWQGKGKSFAFRCVSMWYMEEVGGCRVIDLKIGFGKNYCIHGKKMRFCCLYLCSGRLEKWKITALHSLGF